MDSCHRWHHDLQRFMRDLSLHWGLASHLPIEGRILWIRARGNRHSSCLEMMDAGETRQLRRVVRRRGCVCPGGLFRQVILCVKELSYSSIEFSDFSLLDHNNIEQAITEAG